MPILTNLVFAWGRPFETRRFPAAVVQLRTVVTNDAEFAPAHNDLGVALLQSARAAEGAAELREALRLDPTNAQTAYNLALSLNQLGQWAEAVRLLVPLAEAQPGNPMTQCQCAVKHSLIRETCGER